MGTRALYRSGMQIETERLLLRDFAEDDWRSSLAYHQDERYWQFYEAEAWDETKERARLQWFLDWQNEQPRRRFQLAIVLRDEDSLIGNVGLRVRRSVIQGGDGDWEGDIGYELDPRYWGQGYATEAASAIVAFGFEHLKLHRVWSFCIAENERSWRLMERLGMQREGRLRENEWMRSRWWDTLLYAILEDEWRARE
jgi:RimJ/RimL family protein N-acetyltransferase